jgi:hypothetical protein
MTRVPFDVNDADARSRFFRHDLAQALAALDADARPGWGAMTAQQMVEHLQWGFEVSTGRVTLECAVPEAKRARSKPFLFDDTPMRHEFRNRPWRQASLPCATRACPRPGRPWPPR